MAQCASAWHSALTLTLLCLLVSFVVSQPAGATKMKRGRFRINCERYPYAPRCRGVSAKRSMAPGTDTSQDDFSLENAILSSFRSYQRRKAAKNIMDALYGMNRNSERLPSRLGDWNLETMSPGQKDNFDSSP